MAGRGPQSFKKRQKEQQRKEKQQEKLAKRLQRKLEPRPAEDPDDQQLLTGEELTETAEAEVVETEQQ